MMQKKEERFQAMNDYVQIEPIKEEKSDKIVLAEVKKKKTGKGRVLSVGIGKDQDLKCLYIRSNQGSKEDAERISKQEGRVVVFLREGEEILNRNQIEIKVGDIVLFNPHLVQEIEDGKGTIYITNISTIYGKYGK